MMKKLLPLFLFALPCFGQATITMFPTATTSPIYGVPTCTAIVNGVNDKTVTWTTTGGTIRGANPSTVNEPATAGLYSTVSGNFTLTATSNADHTKTATCAVTFGASPIPATAHPRFLVTTSGLAALQAKGVTTNPIYNAIYGIANNYKTSDASVYTFSTWNGSACTGGSGPNSDQSGNYLEVHAMWMAWVSLADANATTRNTFGCAARDIMLSNIMYTLNGELDLSNGNQWSDSSFNYSVVADWLMGGGYLSADDQAMVRAFFAKYNFEQVTNSNYGSIGPIGTYNQPATLIYGTTNGGQPNESTNMRAMGNNYTHSKILLTAMAALTFNDNTTDDPTIATGGVAAVGPANSGGSGWAVGDQLTAPGGFVGKVFKVSASGAAQMIEVVSQGSGYTNNGTPVTATATAPSTGTGLTLSILAGNTCGAARGTVCADGTVPSLHSYWRWITGSMLYRDWAALEDPGVVQQSYNATYANMATAPQCHTWWNQPNGTMPCLGMARGGESLEGMFYGYSFQRLLWVLNAIHTAGYDDPNLYGPQMSLFSSSTFDLRYLTDYANHPSLGGSQSEAGSRWTMNTDADTLYYFTYPGQLSEAALLAHDSYVGRTDRKQAVEWELLNTAFGMASGTVGSCASYCGYTAELSSDFASPTAIDAMIALPAGDPTAPGNAPADPRASLPTDIYVAGNKHIILRDGGWDPTSDTMFTFFAPDTQIDHEHQVDGRFDIVSAGEYITKGRMEFNNYNSWNTYAPYSNELGIVNSVGTTVAKNQYPWGPSVNYGQEWHGNQAGLTTLNHSELPTYAAMNLISTNAYNGGNGDFAPYTDVSAASRDLIYLRSGKEVITYDRAAVGHAASTQSVSLNTTGPVTWTSGTGKWKTRSNTQDVYYTPLLPIGASANARGLFTKLAISAPDSTLATGATMQATCTATYADGTTQNCLTVPDQTMGQVAQWYSDNTAVCTVSASGVITAVSAGTCNITAQYNYQQFVATGNMPVAVGATTVVGTVSADDGGEQQADWEPSEYITVTPSGTPLSSNFLGVLRWGASGFTPATASNVSSTSGQAYDCALVGGTTLTCFAQVLGTFTGVTYPASGATTHYVADLTPNTTYNVTGIGTPATVTTDNAGVATFAASGTGNITVGTYTAPTTPPTPTPTPTTTPPVTPPATSSSTLSGLIWTGGVIQ